MNDRGDRKVDDLFKTCRQALEGVVGGESAAQNVLSRIGGRTPAQLSAEHGLRLLPRFSVAAALLLAVLCAGRIDIAGLGGGEAGGRGDTVLAALDDVLGQESVLDEVDPDLGTTPEDLFSELFALEVPE